MTLKKEVDYPWDFRKENVKRDTHCFHNYPAMMIPQIAEKLIQDYGKGATSLFDPYCGTGTSLVEANLYGINAFGTDLNPIARLIARTKTSQLCMFELEAYIQKFNNYLFSFSFGTVKENIRVPDFKNINYWFFPKTISELAIVKEFIDEIKNEKIRDFFSVAFSETVRESSLTRNGEFKLYRMTEEQISKFKPDVFSMMTSKIFRNKIGIGSFLKKTESSRTQTSVFGFDSSLGIQFIENESIDLVVTSPPYGDSKTTVAYGQFSRLSNQWLGLEDASQVDNLLMGGTPKEIRPTGLQILDDSIEAIATKDKNRTKEVYSFYFDYIESIHHVAKVIRPNGHACYVVGNRRVKDITLLTDEVTKAVFERCGFEHKATFIRNIPNKRMPSKNSPTNQTGKTATTMNNEYIVVMKKK